MEDDGEDAHSSRRGADASGASGPSMGPIYLMWENGLEKLKILNYEKEYCKKLNKKPFSRIHFVLPGNNPSVQFDDFIGLCSWLFTVIDRLTDVFKPEEFDDPNTVVNKLVLALRQLDFRSAFPSQKIKVAHGEPACAVIDFLVDKALASINFQWGVPIYAVTDDVEQAEVDDEAEEDGVEEDMGGGIEEEDGLLFEETVGALETSMDNSTHNILQADVDPVLWKTELERVGPKLKASQQVLTNEWRSHVDQTVTSKGKIDLVLGETQTELMSMNKNVSNDLNHMKMKEKYLNNQYNILGLEFIEVKNKLEVVEKKSSSSHESVAKLTNELAEISEKLDDLKESFDSKDTGMHDTSPLVKIKGGLQQIKSDIHFFDMRIGVVNNSLLTARVSDSNRLRAINASKARKRHNKSSKRNTDEDSTFSDEE
jgi:estrogen-related receptor beta like 1